MTHSERDELKKAEEYERTGMLDKATTTLKNILGNHPDFADARLALGRIYLSRDMLAEAQNEFEKARDLTPESIAVRKRLADIYCKQKKTEKALQEYQTILNLRPEDEEARAVLNLLKSGKKKESAEDIQQSDTESVNTGNVPVYEIQEETETEELGIELPQKLSPVHEGKTSRELEEFRNIMDIHTQQTSKGSDKQKDEGTGSVYVPPHASEESGEDLKTIPSEPREESPEGDRIIISMPTETMADIFVNQGLYSKAMDIYNEILSSDPENKRIIQRREELKMLINIKGNKA
jgi:tetratricopeptide (TPR) repeat protein